MKGLYLLNFITFIRESADEIIVVALPLSGYSNSLPQTHPELHVRPQQPGPQGSFRQVKARHTHPPLRQVHQRTAPYCAQPSARGDAHHSGHYLLCGGDCGWNERREQYHTDQS